MDHVGIPRVCIFKPMPVVIAGSFLSNVGDHDNKRPMTPLSLNPYY